MVYTSKYCGTCAGIQAAPPRCFDPQRTAVVLSVAGISNCVGGSFDLFGGYHALYDVRHVLYPTL